MNSQTLEPSTTPMVGKRYIVEEQLGRGAMGMVFRATDRLSGQQVALKRVTTSATQLSFASRSDPADFEVALAREFHTLASLRHPHIISVLDYGFDEQKQPFFTMSLLENAQTILKAGQGRDLEVQIDLLLQLLQALAYLHRRGILHRDLKPGNVMVVDDKVKVLDFGLSLIVNPDRVDDLVTSDSISGTLAYMAPELLNGESPSRSSDLYAVGMIAYELLSGRYPFDQGNTFTIINQILTLPPENLERLGIHSGVAGVVDRLLLKSSHERYQRARLVIEDLSGASQRPLPQETTDIRESFIQAARFVGRKAELAQLTEVLDKAMQGQGSAWLIGGESGVGKSRLMDELRTLALVSGAYVIRSQATRDGGRAYALWRDLIAWLALSTQLTPLEARILKALLPNIDDLLQRDVPEAPELAPVDAQARLFSTVNVVLRRQQDPLVILLEDLHWASTESLALLAWLLDTVGTQPLLIIGNYRDDEQPNLPEQLPGMHLMKLERLEAKEIAALSESILGQTGRQQPVLDLLQRETEGNPFFLVEVVRALAEEAGRLDKIHRQTLPATVFTGGLENLIRRRLNQVAPAHMPLLQIAAVSGRRLDLNVIAAAGNGNNLEQWLTDCANAAVLNVQDDQWQFAHDKLREGILTDLDEAQQRQLHARVARSIETVYPDTPDLAATLTYHWSIAGQEGKEMVYALRAGQQAIRGGANHDAVQHLERALSLSDRQPEPEQLSHLEKLRIRHQLGQAYLGLGQLDTSRDQLERMLAQAGWPVPASSGSLILTLLKQVGTQLLHRLWPKRFLGSASPQQGQLLLQTARAYQNAAEIYYYASDKLRLLNAGFHALNLSERAGPSSELANAYGSICTIMAVIPQRRMAELYSRLGQETAQAIDDNLALGWVLLNSGTATLGYGQWNETLTLVGQAVDLLKSVGDQRYLGLSYAVLALAHCQRGEFGQASDFNETWFQLAIEARNVQQQTLALVGQAECALRLGRPAEAIELAQARVDEITAGQTARIDSATRFRQHGVLAAAHWRQGQEEEARQAIMAALEHEDHIASPSRNTLFDGLANVASTSLALWEAGGEKESAMVEASGKGCEILARYARVFPSMAPRAMLVQGLAKWLNQEEDAAVKGWQKALALANELAMPYEQALAHYEIGRHAEGTVKDEHLAHAIALFEALGTQGKLAEATTAANK